MKTLVLVLNLLTSMAAWGDEPTPFPEDYEREAMASADRLSDVMEYRRLGQQLLSRPSLEETRVPPPEHKIEFPLRTIMQFELKEQTAASIEYLSRALVHAEVITQAYVDRPLIGP